MPKEQRHLTTPVPPLLSPEAPKDYGTGRKCYCGARVHRYTKVEKGEKGPKCDHCKEKEYNERLDAEMAEIEERRQNALKERHNGRRLGKLEEIRTERGLSQVQLARVIGKSEGYIHNVESRMHGISPENIDKLAHKLGVSPEELGW